MLRHFYGIFHHLIFFQNFVKPYVERTFRMTMVHSIEPVNLTVFLFGIHSMQGTSHVDRQNLHSHSLFFLIGRQNLYSYSLLFLIGIHSMQGTSHVDRQNLHSYSLFFSIGIHSMQGTSHVDRQNLHCYSLFFLLGIHSMQGTPFTPCKTLRDIELQEKEARKDLGIHEFV